MRAALVATLLLLTAPARADGDLASGPRLWLGPAAALDPAFLAMTGGADWFLHPGVAVGVSLAHTLGVGDQLATETGYGYATALARLRGSLGPRSRAELLAGAGAARVHFGAPGIHTDWSPDLAGGAALGWSLPHRLELAVELTTHITLAQRAAGRNAAHTSELVSLVLRCGG
jgi:hypothetical protein